MTKKHSWSDGLIGWRLKDERERLRLTVKELADKLGVDEKIQFEIESSERTVPAQYLAGLYKLGIDINLVVTGDFYSQSPFVKTIREHFEPFIQIPLYDAKVSAGNGATFDDDLLDSFLPFTKRFLIERGLNENNVAAVTVRGDSMSPTIKDNDKVLVDLSPMEHFTDGVYILRVNDYLLIKRIQHQLTGDIEILSDNPAYKTQLIPKDQLGDIHVIGRVVWMGLGL